MKNPPRYADVCHNKKTIRGGFMPSGSAYASEPKTSLRAYLSTLSEKDKPWDTHRGEAEGVTRLYRKAGHERYADRIENCSQWLLFVLSNSTPDELSLKLSSACFCRVRHCPVCQWRRSLMWRARFIKSVPRLLHDYPNIRFIFLTLTVRNCEISQLRDTLDRMNQAWKRLIERKVYPGLGFVKSVEVTRNSDDDTAHPHFHCLIAVPSSYFVGRVYLKQEKWTELWKSCLRIDYTPIVNVKSVKPRKGSDSDGLMVALCETLKYAVKPEDLLSNAEWLKELTQQLYNTRGVAIGGILKEYISDREPDDLIHGDDEADEITDEDIKLIFDWSSLVKRYVQRL